MLVGALAERAHVTAAAATSRPADATAVGARRHLTDTVGALIAGWVTLHGKVDALADAVGLRMSPDRDRVRLARRVAYAGGAYAHCWELDDIERASILCPGCVILPAVLAALLLRPRLTWPQLVAAYAAGYAVALGAGAEVDTAELIARGWWPTSVLVPAGAAAAISIALGHDLEQTTDAIGLAAQQAGGLLTGTNDGRYLNPGIAAERALSAALMADAGWHGPRDVFDGSRSPLRRRECATAISLGDVSLKRHAAAKHLQAALDIAVELRDRCQPVEQVTEVRVALPTSLAPIVDRPAPFPTATGALASAQYTVALVLRSGGCYPRQFAPDYRGDAGILSLAQRVRVLASDELARDFPRRWGARVEIDTGSGSLGEERHIADGDPERALSSEQLLAKFATTASGRPDGRPAAEIGRALLQETGERAWQALRDDVLPLLVPEQHIEERS